jgi:hypothetical protein
VRIAVTQMRTLELAFIVAFAPSLAKAQIVLNPKDSFINTYKNRVTIEADLTIDHAHSSPKRPSPKKPSNDGDIHVAARATSIGLPIVAEMMNAADARPSIKVFTSAAENGTKVNVKGAWRFWCEHGGTADQIQGNPVAKAEHTNPDHCFQIHPVNEIDGVDVGHTGKRFPI